MVADRPRSAAGPLGIVGAGQLARMTIEAASALAIPVVLLAEDPTAAATEITSRVLLGAPRPTPGSCGRWPPAATS